MGGGGRRDGGRGRGGEFRSLRAWSYLMREQKPNSK